MRKATFISILYFMAILNLSNQTLQENNSYKAAVVEYAPYYSNASSAVEIMNRNADQHIEFIERAAKQNVDIIVFPECGITSINHPRTRDKLHDFATRVPSANEHTVLCNNNNVNGISKAMEKISCTAAKYKIYVAINVIETYNCNHEKNCPTDGVFIYNTNVVFDRRGEVIARYRKYNLCSEPGFNITEKAETTTFTTDFGVTFGMFICFDILFEKPALKLVREMDIHDFVYSVAWFNFMPFITALTTQSGWVRSQDVTLLAAGYNSPSTTNGGSGIYIGRSHSTVYLPKKLGSKMIVANIPKTKYNKSNVEFDEITGNEWTKDSELNLLKDNFTDFTTELLDFSITNSVDKTICNNDICCTFEIEVQPKISNDYKYRLTAFDGQSSYCLMDAGVQACGLVACLNDDIDSCGGFNKSSTVTGQQFKKITVKGNFRKTKHTFQFPSTLTYEILPIKKYEYYFDNINDTYNNIVMNIENVQSLLTFGVYARDTSLDKWNED